MKEELNPLSLDYALNQLKHLLPSQGPLKDFIHHNTLHAFQHWPFHTGLEHCSRLLGTQVYLSHQEYIELFRQGKIDEHHLEESYLKNGFNKLFEKQKLFEVTKPTPPEENTFLLRGLWKNQFQLDIDGKTHSFLFRILCGYLDQGISVWKFPATSTGFLDSLRKMDQQSYISLFSYGSRRAWTLLHNPKTTLADVLKLIVGREDLHGHYVFDQQFSHPGWSGLVSQLEIQPESLLAPRKISLHDLILFELLLELDFLDFSLGESRPLLDASYSGPSLKTLLTPPESRTDFQILICWQDAFEKTYYNSCLRALKEVPATTVETKPLFQAAFCLDDRECSLRRHIEKLEPAAETFGTPGFFGVEFFYQPENSFHLTKLCPAPVTPKHLIKQSQSLVQRKKDLHLESTSHSFFGGWLISQSLGYWSAFKLFLNIFRPSLSPATASSLRHMDKISKLSIENEHIHHHEQGLQVGFTIPEMIERVSNTLSSIGLVQNFADLVYLVAHGSSSINNPHYAAYDCGACCGRPGSVNARVFAHMANHPEVRQGLLEKGIIIPRTTLFIGALHDTARDEIEFFEEDHWPQDFILKHKKIHKTFNEALCLNSKERSRRFLNTPLVLKPEDVNALAKIRSVSLFEPRPELNHATNSLCIVGRRALTQKIFLDRRAFLNSYDASIDHEGFILTRILNAAVPVCGGINLEYYFSRVDNQKLGAGSKLPHNVMGLIGVANGIDGDLRPGLPSQMIEVHDPVRLLVVVEHKAEVVLKAVQRNPATYEWIENEWVRIASIDPETKQIHFYEDGHMRPFEPIGSAPVIEDLSKYLISSRDNLSIGLIKEKL